MTKIEETMLQLKADLEELSDQLGIDVYMSITAVKRKF